MNVLNIVLAAFYAGCLIWAAFSDLRGLRIGNGISLALIGAFPVYALFSGYDVWIGGHLITGAVMLGLTFCLFMLHMIGGGDAKLIAAVSLWAGPQNLANFLLALALLGGAMALILVILRGGLRAFPALESRFPAPAAIRWAKLGIMPYGVPIGISGLMLIPRLFQV